MCTQQWLWSIGRRDLQDSYSRCLTILLVARTSCERDVFTHFRTNRNSKLPFLQLSAASILYQPSDFSSVDRCRLLGVELDPQAASQVCSFYREFQRNDLGYWHNASDHQSTGPYVYAPCGLFPRPIGRATSKVRIAELEVKFRLLGKFMAKAVMDFRMVQ